MSPQNITVGVLRGGPSSEHEVSLKTGDTLLHELGKHWPTEHIFIDRDGTWRRDGYEMSPGDATSRSDVIVNGLHGEFGEDGKVQRILEQLGKPYTGSGVLASAIAMNKARTRLHLKDSGIKQPVHTVVDSSANTEITAQELYSTFPQPSVIKPRSLGSSVGVSIVHTYDEILEALANVFTISDAAIVEEYIKGKEATCGVIDDFRGKETYTLPIVEIRPVGHDFFDYDAKYDGSTEEICPGNFTESERNEMQEAAALVHRTLGLRHYSRTDFIVHPKRGVFLLEVNTLPGMTKQSLFPKSLDAVGSNLGEFLTHIVGLAHTGKC